MSFNLNTYATTSSLIDRVRFFTNYIEEFGERDLYNFFIEIVQEIFGRGSTKGWALDSLRTRVCLTYIYYFLLCFIIFKYIFINST